MLPHESLPTEVHTETYRLLRGNTPLVVSIPHLGTNIPPAIKARLTDAALAMADTDWHLDRVYAFAKDMGATIIQSKLSRYVIDLNRPPNGLSLYPEQNTTELCPTTTFRNEAVYLDGQKPSAQEVQERLQTYWQPYHSALANELQRLRNMHNQVLLWDGHSIAGELPYLFDGKLPDLNLGTNDGKACDARLLQAVASALQRQGDYSFVANQRFKGGYITRNYGNPALGVHAIQLEMAQHLYMQESAPFPYHASRAQPLQALIQGLINSALQQLPASK